MAQQKPTINLNAPVESTKQAAQTGLQEALGTVQQTIPPSNEQISQAIDTTNALLDEKAPNLPSQASKAVGDISRVLDDTKAFLKEKNPDESLQKIIVEGTEAAKAFGAEAQQELQDKKGYAYQYQGQAKEVFNASTAAVREIVRSSEFRVLLLDLLDIFENAFWRTEKSVESAAGGQKGPSIKQALKEDINKSDIPGGKLEKTTEVAKSIAKRVKYNLRDEKTITPEERRLLRTRFSKVLMNLKNNPQFCHATQGLVSLFQYIYKEIADSANNVQTTSQYRFERVTCESRKFLERFTSGQTMDNFSKSVRSFAKTISEDKQLDLLFEKWKWLFDESLKNPDLLVSNQDYINKVEAISRDSRNYFQATANNNTDIQDCITEGKNILNGIAEDPLCNRLASDTKIMVQNFFQVDATGKPTINFELINQLKGLVVPLLTEHLGWVPLPLVEGSNDSYDYWFDNIVFCAPTLVPDQIHVRMASEGDVDLKDLQAQNFESLIHLCARGIKTTIKDVEFWFRRKSFPTTEDHGYATMEVLGDGATVDIVLGVSRGENPFSVKKVNVTLDALKLSIADTRHDWLYNTLVTLFGGVIKHKLCTQIEEGLSNLTATVNTQLNRIVYKTYQETTSALETATAQKINVK